MRIKGSTIFAGVILLSGLVGIIQSSTFHYWESMVLPLMVSCFVCFLASMQLGLELKHQFSKKPGEIENDKVFISSQNKLEMKRIGKLFSWAVGFVLFIYLFGFYLAVPVFSFAYLKWASRTWLTSLVFAAIFFSCVYLIFSTILNVSLYKGLIFSF